MYMSLGGHNQDLNQKKVAVIVLLALVLSMTFIIFNPTLAQTNNSQKQKAETLLAILSNDNTTLADTFSNLNAQNITAPTTAKTAYNKGIEHTEEAFRLMSEKQFDEASIEAVQAMNKFEETLKILDSASPVEQTETEVTAQEVINLKANITRATEYAERLENLTERTKTQGYNTAAIEQKLSEIKQHLRNATQQLHALNLDEATEELLNAQTLLEELQAPFDRLTNLVKTSNIETYLEAAEGRVSETKENITQSTTLTAAAKEDAITALNNSEASLANARDSLTTNDVDAAIKNLEEAKEWEEESKRAITAVTATPNSISATEKSSTKAEVTASR
jgi:hypothetical protein